MSEETLKSKLPLHTIGGLQRYIEQGIAPGDFLRAVLSNDLKEAFGRADSINRDAMFDIVNYLYNEAPFSCWGSPEKVEAWLQKFNPEA